MTKVAIVTADEALPAQTCADVSGDSLAWTYFDAKLHPLQLQRYVLPRDGRLQLAPRHIDHIVYVWRGAIVACGVALQSGSSLIVEHGASVTADAAADNTVVLIFAAAAPPPDPKHGGRVHLLPTENVARIDLKPGLRGGLHADSDCPTCAVWLHENEFAGGVPRTAEEMSRGVHAHTEDEIIFVTSGSLQFGNRRCGAGTALAIAADTFYSFLPGDEGLAFVNFRAAMPGDIRSRSGHTMSETAYWRERSPRPQYLFG